MGTNQPSRSTKPPFSSGQAPCHRCQGLMVREYCFDLSQTGDFEFFAWRCVQCGNLVDSVILQNRENHSHEKNSTRSKWSGHPEQILRLCEV